MTKGEINGVINKKVKELAKKYASSRTEMMRQLLVAGIRNFPGEKDFLRPYPVDSDSLPKLTKKKQKL